MDNKKFLYIGIGVLVLIILIALVTASCSKKGNKTTASTTLVFWDYTDNSKAFENIFTQFQDANNVKINYVVKDPKNYATDALAVMAAGNGPDIWSVPNNWVIQYQNQLTAMPSGKLADKKAKLNDTEVYQKSYPNAVSQENIINNQIYGAPLTVDPLVLFYNSDIIGQTQADLQKNQRDVADSLSSVFSSGPKNWDEFNSLVKYITQKNGSNITQSAVALGSSGNIDVSSDILTLLMLQNGTKMTSDDHLSALFATQQNAYGYQDYPGARSLSYYSSFANSGNENYTWNSSFEDSLHAFATGKTAMMFNYLSAEKDLKAINANFKPSIYALPQIKETKNPVNMIRYSSYTVPKASKNSALAWNFVLFASSETNSNQFATLNGQISAWKQSFGSEQDYTKTTQSWYNPNAVNTVTVFKDMIDQTLAGKNAQTTMENAASQITTLLAKLKG